jgi:ankyrin repeat protein
MSVIARLLILILTASNALGAQPDDGERARLADAVFREDFTKAEAMVKRGIPLDSVTINGFRILDYAAVYGKENIVKWLIGHGAGGLDRALIASVSAEHHQPSLKATEALVAGGADINSIGESGGVAALEALQNGHVEIARWLIDRGTKPTVRSLLSLCPKKRLSSLEKRFLGRYAGMCECPPGFTLVSACDEGEYQASCMKGKIQSGLRSSGEGDCRPGGKYRSSRVTEGTYRRSGQNPLSWKCGDKSAAGQQRGSCD